MVIKMPVNNISRKEIAHNLEILEKSIKKGKAKKIDIGFIEIFANDIASLSSPPKSLSGRLSKIATEICKVQKKPFFPPNPNDSIRPLIGKKTSLDALIKEHSEGFVKTGLETLSSHFSMTPIAGDGHCLFRSVAVGIFDFLRTASSKDQRNFFDRLGKTVDSLKKTNRWLEKKYENMLKLVEKINSKKKTPEEILKDRQTSDCIVHFLRDLACTYNEAHGNEVFESEATVEAGSKKAYLHSIRDTRQATIGGEAEILALKKTLGIDLQVLDARAIGKGDAEVPALNRAEKNKPSPIYLLFRPGHYDIAFPKV